MLNVMMNRPVYISVRGLEIGFNMGELLITGVALKSIASLFRVMITLMDLVSSTGPWFMWLTTATLTMAVVTPTSEATVATAKELPLSKFMVSYSEPEQQKTMPTLANRPRTTKLTVVRIIGPRCLPELTRLWNEGPWLVSRDVWTVVSRLPMLTLVLLTPVNILVVLLTCFRVIRQWGDLGTANVSILQTRVGMYTYRNTYR